VDAFLGGLRDLGYVEGQTVAIEWRFSAPGSENQFPSIAEEFVRLPVDVIVTASGTPPALAAQHATSTIPIVFIGCIYPVERGLVSSLARPGANVTGLSSTAPGFEEKLVDLLRDVVPGLSRLAAIVDATNPIFDRVMYDKVSQAADRAHIATVRVDV